MANLADLMISVGASDGKFATTMRGLPAKAQKATDGIVDRFKAMAPKLEAAAKAGGAVAAAGVVYGATEGLEREALGDKLAAQLRLTEGESQKAGKISGKLYAGAYGESLEEVNEAVRGVVGGGLADLENTEAVERLSAKALDLAAAFDGDVSTAIGNARVLLSSGLAKDADKAFDLIVAGSQEMAPHLQGELSEIVEEYTKHFSTLGLSGEQMFGLITQAEDKFTLDKTGDALKEFTLLSTDMSARSVAAYDAIGLNARDMADSIAGGGPKARAAFDQIIDGLSGIKSPSEQANTAIALFGSPIEDLGVHKIPEFLDSLDTMGGGLGDVAGRADELGTTLNDNGKTRVEGFKRKVDGMLASVTEAPGILGDAAVAVGGMGQVLEPFGPAIAGAGLLFRDQLGSMASSAAKSTGKAAKAVATGSGKAVAALARWAAAGAAWAAQTVAAGAKALASMVITAARFTAHYAAMAAKALLAASKIALSWIIAMGPIAIVIAAVVGLVVAVVKNWDTIKAVTGKVWDWIWGKIKAVGGFIYDHVKGVHDRITGAIRAALDTVKSIVSGAWDAVLGAIRRYVDLMLTVYVRIPKRIVSALGNLGGILVQKGRDTIDGLRKGITAAWGLVSSWLGRMRSRIVTGIGNQLSTLHSVGRDLLQGLINGIKSVAGKVTGAVTAPIKNAVNAGKKLLGIASPSKVFAEMGRNVGRGFVDGMDDMHRVVQRSAANLTDITDLGGAIRPATSVGIGAGASSSSNQGGKGMNFYGPVSFGDSDSVRDIDLWTRSQSAGR